MANGLPLAMNVLAAGLGGFLFWIVTARSAEPAVVAHATAMVASMFGVAQLSQQHLIDNVPPLPRLDSRAIGVRSSCAGLLSSNSARPFSRVAAPLPS